MDIGFGMTAIPMAGLFKSSKTEQIKKDIHAAIKKCVPTGFNSFTSIQPDVEETLTNKIYSEIKPTKWLTENILPLDKTKFKLGTLGGGNHFIEVVFDENDDKVWGMLHSGKTTAEHHNDVAIEEMKANKIKNRPQGLAFLHIEVIKAHVVNSIPVVLAHSINNTAIPCTTYIIISPKRTKTIFRICDGVRCMREFMLDNVIKIVSDMTQRKTGASTLTTTSAS